MQDPLNENEISFTGAALLAMFAMGAVIVGGALLVWAVQTFGEPALYVLGMGAAVLTMGAVWTVKG